MYTILVVGDEVFITGALAQMVSSKYQTYIDGIRLAFYRMGAVVGFAVSTLEYQRMDITSGLHLFIILVSIIILLTRSSVMKNPKIVIS